MSGQQNADLVPGSQITEPGGVSAVPRSGHCEAQRNHHRWHLEPGEKYVPQKQPVPPT